MLTGEAGTLTRVQSAPHQRYQAVAVAAWDCLVGAGDARAAWVACTNGTPHLRHSPEIGWHGVVDDAGDHGRLQTIAIRAARPPWRAVQHFSGMPAFIVGTSKGDPRLFTEALSGRPGALIEAIPGMLGGHVAAALGIGTHLGAAPSAACSTGLYAVLAAADLIEAGTCSHALAGAADCALEPWLIAGFRALGVLTGDVPPQAFSVATGFAPAEGAGFLALAGAGPWRLLGGVRLGDASHPTRCEDPATLGGCLQALWDILPEPDLIVTHGTGTLSGDAYESAGLNQGPWRTATRMNMKPVIGHCLGASGAVELAVALEAPVKRLWKVSLGFGGHLAAVAVARA